jgi:hypothetical protein
MLAIWRSNGDFLFVKIVSATRDQGSVNQGQGILDLLPDYLSDWLLVTGCLDALIVKKAQVMNIYLNCYWWCFC